MKLSKRLAAVASMVTAGNRTADVGCDHGYVPIWLVENGIVPGAIAADVRPGPLERAAQHIREHRLEERIETRLSDGLMKIAPGEADTLIMSGIGGLLMVRLLSDREETARSFHELILSPQSELDTVRRYLAENGYTIDYEHVLCDEEKYYFIFHVTVKQDPRSWTVQQYHYGRDICREDYEVYLACLNRELEQYDQILGRLQAGPDSQRAGERIREVTEKRKALEEYINEVH